MDITGIDLLDQNVVWHPEASLKCTQVSGVLIYLIKMCVCHLPILDSDVDGYHSY